MGHGTPDVHLLSHQLAIDKIDVALLQLLDGETLLDKLKELELFFSNLFLFPLKFLKSLVDILLLEPGHSLPSLHVLLLVLVISVDHWRFVARIKLHSNARF